MPQKHYLNAGLLLICLCTVQPHAPHNLQAVLHQCLDELELVKVQQLHQFILHGSIGCRALHTKSKSLFAGGCARERQ